jgi:hypothetical protein
MRGVEVKPAGLLRDTVLFVFIERTSTEAAEQTPRQRRVRAGGRGHERSEAERVAHTDHRPEAGGFVFAEPKAPAPLLSVPAAKPGHQRLIREAWKRAPLLHYGSQR